MTLEKEDLRRDLAKELFEKNECEHYPHIRAIPVGKALCSNDIFSNFTRTIGIIAARRWTAKSNHLMLLLMEDFQIRGRA